MPAVTVSLFFNLNPEIMASVMIALILIGLITFIVMLLKFVHRRDQKAEAAKNAKTE
jgi:uncharacterized membrane protein